MSCIITYKGQKYSEEQFKEYFINNKQEFVTSIAKNKDVIDSFKRKMEGIDFVFSQSPEIASIGSKAQYLQYLSTIFKTSKVKDIVYHGTDKKFDVFDFTIEKTDPFTKDGAYFATIPYDYKEKLPALLDIKNPKEFADITDTSNKFGELEKSTEFDSAIGKSTVKGYENYREYVVFEPKQIHVLGSQTDIQRFKEFVQGKQFQKLTAEESITIDQEFNEHPLLEDLFNEDKVLYQEYRNSQLGRSVRVGSKKDREQALEFIQEKNQNRLQEELEDLDKKCSPFKAEDGYASPFTPGGTWKIKKLLKGKSHKQGGIDITIDSDNNVRFQSNNSDIHAAHGMLITDAPKVENTSSTAIENKNSDDMVTIPMIKSMLSDHNSEDEDYIRQRLKSEGYKDYHIDGILGNLQYESNFNPSTISGDNAVGVAQWLGSRREALYNYAKENNKPWDDIETQMDFMLHELNTTEKKAALELKKTKNPKDAAHVWGKYYERFDGGSKEKRQKIANDLSRNRFLKNSLGKLKDKEDLKTLNKIGNNPLLINKL